MSATVVVIGGAGFIGSHLCRRLAQGARVISLDNYFTGSRENHVPGVDYRTGHARDIASQVPETPDIVFHLGEYSRVEEELRRTGAGLGPQLRRHLRGAGILPRAAHGQAGLCRVLHQVRRMAGWGRDQSPYAWTKAASTELVRNYGACMPQACDRLFLQCLWAGASGPGTMAR